MKVIILAIFFIAGALGMIHYFLHTAPSIRITGGEDSDISLHPYQISLQWGINGIFRHMCGGSIIRPNLILTAGHCVTDLPFEGDMQVVAGITKLKEASKGQTVQVVKRIAHPNFDGGRDVNDIAVLVLEHDLEYNDDVKAITLPAQNTVPYGDGVLSGWGSTSTGSNPIRPDHLQKVTLPVITFEECDAAFKELIGRSDPLSDISNVCGANPGNHKSACSGDSGGPFVQNNTIIGVVSWGLMPCGSDNAPSVFTKVSSFVDWINKQ